MARSVVDLFVNDNGFNQKLKGVIHTFASLGNAANGAKSQFSKFAEGIAHVAQSQGALNAALKGNPYGLMAQAATMAFTKIIEKATAATDAEMRAYEWSQKKAEMEQTANEAIGKSVGDLMAKYEMLRMEWINLSNEQQRIEWIDQNKNAFKSLDLAVTDVTSAENVFVKNTEQVVSALKARAEAEAYAELYKDSIKKNATDKATGKYKPNLITDPYYKPSEIEAQAAGFTAANKHENFEYKWVENADPRNPGKHREWTGRLSQTGLNRLNQNRQLGATTRENADRMESDQWAAKMIEAQQRARELSQGGLFGFSGGGSGSGSTKQNLPEYDDFNKQLFKSMNGGDLKNEFEHVGVFDMMKDKAQFDPENILGSKDAWESAKDTIAGAIGGIGESLDNLSFEGFQESYEKVEKDVKGLTKNLKQQNMAMSLAASAANSFGAALSGIDDPAAKAAGTVVQAIANIALGFAMAASAKDTTASGWAWLAWVAAGMAAMATTISTIHSLTGYANGGMIEGNSYSGDNLTAMGPDGGLIGLNAGEVILNKAQQNSLADQLTGNGMGNIRVIGKIRGSDIILSADRALQESGRGQLLTWG